jgi:uncharacterized protein YlzI (FlbEa/FlbD family)
MYAAETNGDQAKTVVEEGISDEVAQKVFIFIKKIFRINFK